MVDGISQMPEPQSRLRESLCLAGVYGQRMAAYGDIAPVRAACALYSPDGRLLLEPGAPFDTAVQQGLVALGPAVFGGSAPVASLLSIASPLGAAALQADLAAVVEADSFFWALDEQRQLLRQLATYSANLDQHGLLQQHLTLMAAQEPALYRHSLRTVLLLILLADEMRLPLADKQNLFWAALYHDIGMLYIEPLVLHKTSLLTLAEWAQIQSHVALAGLLLESVNGLPEAVYLAVAEHHERGDGTGYPAAKWEAELSLEGQLLALADSVVAVYANRFEPHGRPWRDVLPIIELSGREYLPRALALLVALVRRSDLPRAGVVGEEVGRDFALQLSQRSQRLQAWFGLLKACLLEIGFTHGDRRLHGLQNLLLHLATAYKGVVVQQVELNQSWQQLLNQVVQDVPQELQDADLLQQEVLFNLHRLSLMLQQYLAAGGSSDPQIQARLEACFGQVRAYLN